MGHRLARTFFADEVGVILRRGCAGSVAMGCEVRVDVFLDAVRRIAREKVTVVESIRARVQRTQRVRRRLR